MAQGEELMRKFNINPIWAPYAQERKGAAYFEPRTAWPAPTYEYWWPFPFPAPEMPQVPQVPGGEVTPSADIPNLSPAMIQASEGPLGFASSAPATRPREEEPLGGLGAAALAGGAVGAGAAGVVGERQQEPPQLPSVNPFDLLPASQGVGATPTPSGQQTSSAPEVLRSQQFGPDPGMIPTPGTVPGFAPSPLAGEIATGGAPPSDIFDPNFIGGWAGPTGAGAAVEAGALGGNASAAQGAVGPALEAGGAWPWGTTLGAVGPSVGLASAIAGSAGEGPATSQQGIQALSNAVALAMLATPAAPFAWIPPLVGAGLGFLPGKDVHKTMMAHEAETQGSQRSLASAFNQAQTPDDIVRAYTAISGTPATVEDLMDPARRASVFRFPLDAEVRTPFEMAVERVLPEARLTPEQVVARIRSGGVSSEFGRGPEDEIPDLVTAETMGALMASRPDLSSTWLARSAQPGDLQRLLGPFARPRGESAVPNPYANLELAPGL